MDDNILPGIQQDELTTTYENISTRRSINDNENDFLKSMGKIADRLWKMKNASMKTCVLSIVLKSVYAQRASHIRLSPWSWLSLLPLWHSEIQIKLCLLFISCFFTVVEVIACVVLLAKMSAIPWVLWFISFQSQQQAILSLGEKKIMRREQTIPNRKMYWQDWSI